MEIAIRNSKKTDFFKKREEKERCLKEAIERLNEHKKRNVDEVYPRDIYDTISNPKIMYSIEYIQLLENVVKAKTSLEIMDMVLEGLLRERISILEELV